VAVKANPKDKAARQVEADREQGQDFKVRRLFKLLISDVFQQYEPQMLDQLDHFLDKYKGQYQFLYLAVCEKFNVEPKVKVQITKKEDKLPVLDSDSVSDSPSASKHVDSPRSTSPEHASKRAKVGRSDAAPSSGSAPSSSRLLELKCGLQDIKIKHLQQKLETLQEELNRVKNQNAASGSAPVPRRSRSSSDSTSSK
jgi:hypothetical protein